jgi:uncharacterized protein DUF6931
VTLKAWELCHLAEIRLTPQGRSLVSAHLTVRQYFDRLIEHGCYADARRVLAHALPKRRALWWACLCARDIDQPPDAVEVIDVVAHYAGHGDEISRRKAEAFGMQFGPDHLTCCLAMAAFFSGDNVSRPDLPPVAPHPFATARLVEVVVYLTSVRKDPTTYKDHLRRYLAQGLQIALGDDPWAAATVSPVSGVPAGPTSPAVHDAGVPS